MAIAGKPSFMNKMIRNGPVEIYTETFGDADDMPVVSVIRCWINGASISVDNLEPSLICYYFFKLGKYCFSKGQKDLYVVLGF